MNVRPPFFDRFGIERGGAGLGPDEARPVQLPDSINAQVSSLYGVFVPRTSLKFGCRGIKLPTPVPTIDTTKAGAWFGLLSFKVDRMTQGSWVGYRCSMLPPDFQSLAYGRTGWSVVGWGDQEGGGALLVLGLNMAKRIPGWSVGAFVGAACENPMLLNQTEPTSTTDGLWPARTPDDFVYVPFPNYAVAGYDTATNPVVPTRREPVINDAPLNVRLTEADTLDVSVVFRMSDYTSWAPTPGRTVAMSVQGELLLSKLQQDRPYTT